MADLSFDIKNSKDFLKKLIDDLADFNKNKTSSRIAINCAMTAWHLTDWIYHEHSATLTINYPELHNYQKWAKTQCSELQIMHDITNGSKHYLLKSHKPQIDRTEVHHGDFNDDFSRDFDISTIDVHMKDGTKVYFEDAIETVVKFWIKYLQENH